MTTTIHHPSCPQRHLDNPLYCGNWPELDHTDCPSSIECAASPWPVGSCICGPDAQPEPEWMGHEPRTTDQMVLDIRAHADGAMADRLHRFSHGPAFAATALGAAVRAVMARKAGIR